jgi:predicted phosphate transport protein (TIGR00153 family)
VGLREWIVPREERFFDLLERQAANVVAGAELMVKLLADFENLRGYAAKIEEVEHTGDSMVHELSVELSKSFLTPFDHEDISRLASKIDDIIDYIDASAKRMWMYKLTEAPPHADEMAAVLLEQARSIDECVRNLRAMDVAAVQERHARINKLENDADNLLQEALMEAFELPDAKTILKLKEVYDFIEAATDRCEDASDVLADIVMKNR